MALSEVRICNIALQRLGAAAITSRTDNNDNARAVDMVFDACRDAVLRAHPWNFAEARAALAKSSTPAFGYENGYQLPADPYCLKVLKVEDIGDLPWRVAGREILTDAGAPLNVVYTKRVTDPAQFDVAFDMALAMRIAWQVARVRVKSRAEVTDIKADYLDMLAEARSADAQEGTPLPLDDTGLIDVRG